MSSWTKAISENTAREDTVTVLQGSCCLRHSETQRMSLTVMVDNTKSESLLPVIKKKIMLEQLQTLWKWCGS